MWWKRGVAVLMFIFFSLSIVSAGENSTKLEAGVTPDQRVFGPVDYIIDQASLRVPFVGEQRAFGIAEEAVAELDVLTQREGEIPQEVFQLAEERALRKAVGAMKVARRQYEKDGESATEFSLLLDDVEDQIVQRSDVLPEETVTGMQQQIEDIRSAIGVTSTDEESRAPSMVSQQFTCTSINGEKIYGQKRFSIEDEGTVNLGFIEGSYYSIFADGENWIFVGDKIKVFSSTGEQVTGTEVVLNLVTQKVSVDGTDIGSWNPTEYGAPLLMLGSGDILYTYDESGLLMGGFRFFLSFSGEKVQVCELFKPEISLACPDGVCSTTELDEGSCPQDCEDVSSSNVSESVAEFEIVCGDGYCDEPELFNESCPEDCGGIIEGEVVTWGYCGDGACDTLEQSFGCPEDCVYQEQTTSTSQGYCGDGTCGFYEESSKCPRDCTQVSGTNITKSSVQNPCGDGICDQYERANSSSCSRDCTQGSGTNMTFAPQRGSYCGDGLCDGPEDSAACPKDCGNGTTSGSASQPGPYCGNGFCDGPEDSAACPKDCGNGTTSGSASQPGPYCGNGLCDGPETSTTCSQDCGTGPAPASTSTPTPAPAKYCGDGICDGPETSTSCSQDCGSSVTTTGQAILDVIDTSLRSFTHFFLYREL